MKRYASALIAAVLLVSACGGDDDQGIKVNQGGITPLEQDIGPNMQITVVQRADGSLMECVYFIGTDARGYRSGLSFFGLDCNWGEE